MSSRVLVTGVSGFLGGHVTLALLREGYAVRGSVRDLARAESVRASLADAGADVARLEFCVLDLDCDAGWDISMRDCRFVQHIASPFMLTMPSDPDDLVRPAVEGTRRVLKAALTAGVERIVLTSSLAAIDGGHADYGRALGPADWTDLAGAHVNAYARSKTLAERAAWELAGQVDGQSSLAVINPGTMLGPLIGDDPGTSALVIQRMLRGRMPMLPDLILPYVDVRDVADVQVAAMLSPQAGGTRTLVTNAAIPLVDIASLLREYIGDGAAKVATRRMPAWFAAVFARFDASLRDSRAYLGVQRSYDASAAASLLGRPLRPTAAAAAATAQSLIERGLA